MKEDRSNLENLLSLLETGKEDSDNVNIDYSDLVLSELMTTEYEEVDEMYEEGKLSIWYAYYGLFGEPPPKEFLIDVQVKMTEEKERGVSSKGERLSISLFSLINNILHAYYDKEK